MSYEQPGHIIVPFSYVFKLFSRATSGKMIRAKIGENKLIYFPGSSYWLDTVLLGVMNTKLYSAAYF